MKATFISTARQLSVRTLRRASLIGPWLLVAGGCSSSDRGDSSAAGGGASSASVAREMAPPGAPDSVFPPPTRPIADIVAPRWSNEDDRDDIGEAERVLRILDPQEGQHIADIGAGDGYYVARLVPRVGESGRVYGEDIVPRYLDLLSDRAARAGWTNVDVVRGEAHDPRLPAATLDAALLVHMYHEITQPFGLLWNLATAMKPGGRVVIVDLDRPTWGHGTPYDLLRCELAAVGYRVDTVDRSVPGEYVAVFFAPAVAERPTPEELTQLLAQNPCIVPGARY